MNCINVVQDPGAFRDETSHILVLLVTACETVAITVVASNGEIPSYTIVYTEVN